jgi:hypothetical protein
VSEPGDPEAPALPAGRDVAAQAPAASTSAAGGRPAEPAGRSSLLESSAPVYRECAGYRLRLDPSDLARLRELPGSRGRTDEELGREFLLAHGDRLAASLAGDVPTPAEIRVVIDPYSRQAFLALEKTIRGIVSF